MPKASRTKLHVAPTLMTTLEDREALARTVLAFADSLDVSAPADIWAVVPVKELDGAKQRLAPPALARRSAAR